MKIRTAHLQPISPQIIPSIFTSYIQLTPTADMNFLISITNAVNIPINPHLSHQINPEHRHEYHNLHNQRRKYPPLKFALRTLQFLPPMPPALNNPIGVSLLAGQG